MAVVEGKSNLIHDPRDPNSVPPDPMVAKGRPLCQTGTLVTDAADSNGSMYHLGNVPSNAVVHEDTFFDVENYGFAQVVIGTKSDTDALVDQTQVTENIVTPFAVGDASHGKRWWEMLGLASDPGGFIAIYAHAEANATGAGNMPFRLAYLQAD